MATYLYLIVKTNQTCMEIAYQAASLDVQSYSRNTKCYFVPYGLHVSNVMAAIFILFGTDIPLHFFITEFVLKPVHGPRCCAPMEVFVVAVYRCNKG
jgi:hypothetical protein